MIQRVRARLLAATALIAVLAGWLLAGAGAWTIAIAVGVLLAAMIVIATALVQGAMRDLIDASRDVARDTSRRVPLPLAEPSDEVSEMGAWINFLAEDADRHHRALARERVLLASVAEGLTQGVVALDGEHRIELLNDAARRMLGVTSSLVGEPLLEFVDRKSVV